jgi:hypothetical protein
MDVVYAFPGMGKTTLSQSDSKFFDGDQLWGDYLAQLNQMEPEGRATQVLSDEHGRRVNEGYKTNFKQVKEGQILLTNIPNLETIIPEANINWIAYVLPTGEKKKELIEANPLLPIAEWISSSASHIKQGKGSEKLIEYDGHLEELKERFLKKDPTPKELTDEALAKMYQ